MWLSMGNSPPVVVFRAAPSSAARPMWKLPDVVSTDMQKLRQQQQQERRLREDIQCQIRAYFQVRACLSCWTLSRDPELFWADTL